MQLIESILLLFMSFLPAIFYSIWIRNTERYHREKWKPIIFCFIWGATIAILASIILELLLGTIAITLEFKTTYILTAVVIAPFAEELIKPMALRYKIVKKELIELEDGLIYGAIAGLGFSATENLFYGYDAFINEGLLFFLILITLRSFGGCLLHASATAWTGFGYGKIIIKKSRFIRVIPYFLLAIFIHATYNFTLTTGDLFGLYSSLFIAIIFVFITIYLVRAKIKQLDISNRG